MEESDITPTAYDAINSFYKAVRATQQYSLPNDTGPLAMLQETFFALRLYGLPNELVFDIFSKSLDDPSHLVKACNTYAMDRSSLRVRHIVSNPLSQVWIAEADRRFLNVVEGVDALSPFEIFHKRSQATLPDEIALRKKLSQGDPSFWIVPFVAVFSWTGEVDDEKLIAFPHNFVSVNGEIFQYKQTITIIEVESGPEIHFNDCGMIRNITGTTNPDDVFEVTVRQTSLGFSIKYYTIDSMKAKIVSDDHERTTATVMQIIRDGGNTKIMDFNMYGFITRNGTYKSFDVLDYAMLRVKTGKIQDIIIDNDVEYGCFKWAVTEQRIPYDTKWITEQKAHQDFPEFWGHSNNGNCGDPSNKHVYIDDPIKFDLRTISGFSWNKNMRVIHS